MKVHEAFISQDGQRWSVEYKDHALVVKNETGPHMGPNNASNWWQCEGSVGAGQTPVRQLLDLWRKGGYDLPADLRRFIVSLFPA